MRDVAIDAYRDALCPCRGDRFTAAAIDGRLDLSADVRRRLNAKLEIFARTGQDDVSD